MLAHTGPPAVCLIYELPVESILGNYAYGAMKDPVGIERDIGYQPLLPALVLGAYPIFG